MYLYIPFVSIDSSLFLVAANHRYSILWVAKTCHIGGRVTFTKNVELDLS